MTLMKMNQTRKGTEDGFVVKQYNEGEIYEVREILARDFFRAGWAVKPSAVDVALWEYEKEINAITTQCATDIINSSKIFCKSIETALVVGQNQEAANSKI